MKNGCKESLVYYIIHLIKGKIIPKNMQKARKLIEMLNNDGDKAKYFNLLGKFYKKEEKYEEAKTHFKMSIDFGSIESIYEYSKLLFLMGEKEESNKYLEDVIHRGYVKAIFKRSIQLRNQEESGQLPKEQEGQWKEFLQTAVEGGHAKANYIYGTLLEAKENEEKKKRRKEGIEENFDSIESIKYYKKAADAGCIESMYKYGTQLFEMHDDKKSKQESIRYIQKASDKGHLDAIYKLGLILVNGDIGIEQDKDQGVRFIQIAAKNGNADAFGSLAQLYMEGKRVPVNTNLAIKYFKKGIEKGSALAMCEYANMLAHGIGVPIDYDLATKYFKMAINKGYTRALNDYAYMMDNMEDVPPDYELSIEYFKLAAKEGDGDAYINLSSKYLKGDGVPINYNLGLKYIKKAMKKGIPTAFHNYACMLREGFAVPVNYEEAIKYAKIAMEKGMVESILLYAVMLEKGEGVPANKKESDKYFQMAIKKGCVNAMIYYAEKILNDTGDINKYLKYLRMAIDHGSADAMNTYAAYCEREKIGSNYMSTVIKYYKMAAERGNINAMANYGHHLLESNSGNPSDIEEGLKYTKKAIDKGCATAMNNYGVILLKGLGGVPINIGEAVKYFEMSAEGGSPEGLFNYGMMLFNGNTIPANAEKAAKYIKRAADFGDYKAMHVYAYFLTEGIGVPVDIQEAIKYYKKAIDKGMVESMFSYAFILQNGMGIPVNYKKAIKYLKIAIDRGFPNAMNSYALMNLNGDGIPVNYEEAIKYFKMAIDKGFTDSMANYATMLAKGIGVKVDKNEAAKYYKMAIDHGKVDSMCDLAYILFTDFLDSINEICINQHNKAKLFDSVFDYVTKLSNTYQAIEYLQTAIDKGSKMAIEVYRQITSFLMTNYYFFRNIPNMSSVYELINSPKKKQNNQIKLFQSGDFYYKKYSKKFMTIAVVYFKESANLNYPFSLFYLGKIYSSCDLVFINKQVAIDYFEKCIEAVKNQYNANCTKKIIELNNIILDLSTYNIALIFFVDFKYKELSEHYFRLVMSSKYPLCQNGLGIFYQFCLKNLKVAEKFYIIASSKKFSLAYYNLGFLKEKENKFNEAIEFYIKASENENESLSFSEIQHYDIQFEISKMFILCLTNLKLVLHFLAKSEISKSKKYFIKSLSKLNNFKFKYNRNVINNIAINQYEYLTIFSYLRCFYLNSALFNIKNQKNLSIEFIENLLSNLKFDFIESNISDPKILFDLVVNNKDIEMKYQFMKEIEFIVQKMEIILHTYPYNILFGKISFENSIISPSFNSFKKDIKEDFYEGFGI